MTADACDGGSLGAIYVAALARAFADFLLKAGFCFAGVATGLSQSSIHASTISRCWRADNALPVRMT